MTTAGAPDAPRSCTARAASSCRPCAASHRGCARTRPGRTSAPIPVVIHADRTTVAPHDDEVLLVARPIHRGTLVRDGPRLVDGLEPAADTTRAEDAGDEQSRDPSPRPTCPALILTRPILPSRGIGFNFSSPPSFSALERPSAAGKGLPHPYPARSDHGRRQDRIPQRDGRLRDRGHDHHHPRRRRKPLRADRQCRVVGVPGASPGPGLRG